MRKATIALVTFPIMKETGEQLFVFQTSDGTALIRRFNQVLRDLDGSALLDRPRETYTNPTDPGLKKMAKRLVGGVVQGDWKMVRAGETYTILPNDPVLNDPSHPEFGKWKEGDAKPYTKDHVRIEGFLDFELSYQKQQIDAVAQAQAQFMAGLSGLFGATASDTASTASGDESISAVDLEGQLTEEIGADAVVEQKAEDK